MYVKVANPVLEIYDGVTKKYLGEVKFALTPDLERSLLNMANYGKAPGSLVVQYAQMYKMADDYVHPEPYKKYPRLGILRATFLDSPSGQAVPMEIAFTYDSLIRSLYFAGHYAGSSEFSNIKIINIKPTIN